MADKTIGELTKATSLDDDSLLIAEQQGDAVSVPGSLLKQYAVEAAAEEADRAEQAKIDTQSLKDSVDATKSAIDEIAIAVGDNKTATETAKDKAEAAALTYPKIENGTWWVWDVAGGAYVDTGVEATGPQGDAFEYEDFTEEQLAALKGEKGDQGDPGTTPHIGDNGNWFVGETDTGVAAQGEKGDAFTYEDFTEEQLAKLVGPAGKSAYEYAQDGGYTGTEEEFAALLGSPGTLFCSKIGMTAEDTAGNNFALLCEAVSKADTVIVDGMYAITVDEAYTIDKNIRFVSGGVSCGFTVSGTAGVVFNVGDNCYQLSAEGLTLSASDSIIILFRRANYTTTRMNFVRVCGCHISGSLSPARFYQSTEVNPEEVDIGVDTISITDNVVENTTATCFVFDDVSYNTFEVARNTVRNFGLNFCYSGVTNGGTYSTEITRSRRKAIIHHNDALCDDDCYYSGTTSLYYVFVLCEGVLAYYHHNRVEGMKSKTDIALYDAYLSCSEVIYEQNVWKNNLVLVEAANNTLMKAKGNGAAEIGTRKYYNNTFILEQSFFEEQGAAEGCYITMISNTSANSWDVRNNEMDIYRLSSFTSSAEVANMTFKGNSLKIGCWVEGALVAGVAGAEIICEDNMVVCEDGTAFNGVRTGSYIASKIVFRNNTLKNCRYILGPGNAEELIADGNVIVNDLSADGRFSSQGYYTKVVGSNNKIVKSGFCTPFNGVVLDSADFSSDMTFVGTVTQGIIISFSPNTSADFIVEFSGKTISKTGTFFKGKVGLTVDGGYLIYSRSSDGVAVTKSFANADGATLLVEMENGDTLPFDVLLHNNGDNCYLIMNKADTDKMNLITRILTTSASVLTIPVELPDDYQAVEYIQSSGTQYIDTGVNASDYSDGISYSFVGTIETVPTDNCWLMGALADSKRSGNINIKTDSTLTIACGGTSTALWIADFTAGETLNIVLEDVAAADPDGMACYINGALWNRSGLECTESDMPDANIHFLQCNGSSRTGTCCKVNSFKMTAADGTVIRNFVPCYRVSDSVAGLYDTANGVFYENAGSDSFTVGADV